MLASQQQARKAISRLLLIMQTAVGPWGGGGEVGSFSCAILTTRKKKSRLGSMATDIIPGQIISVTPADHI